MSDLSVDVDYINKLSLYLEQFKLVRQDVWNARCPICGDSKKKLTKKRFYIYFNADKGYYSTKCHNCGHGAPFSVFLKENYPDLYRDYIVEKFPRNQKKLSPARFSKDIKKIVKPKPKCHGFDYSPLKRFSELPENHPGRMYMENRKLPLDVFFYCPSFIRFLEEIGDTKYTIPYKHAKEPRIIIPFYREDGLSTVFQARAFSKKEGLRYITIKEQDGESKVYGLDRVDYSKPVYVVEGPFDSHMIPNCIAMSGISTKLPEKLKNPIFIYDNEPRNIDVVKTMRKRLLQGYSVVIFPHTIKYNDLNDMVVKGKFSVETLLDIIKDHTYSGPTGLMQLQDWARIK